MKISTVIAISIAVLVVAIGGWFLYWKLFASATSRTAQIYQTQYGAQSAYIEQVDNIIPQIDSLKTTLAIPTTPQSEATALQAQIATLTTQACSLSAEITNKPTNIASWTSANCGGK